ncbi:hypothetical protein KBB68_03305 [Candidatus Babeliales bacterium]|nr:hypothetical protein [Candidatus Babeliales bacterium]
MQNFGKKIILLFNILFVSSMHAAEDLPVLEKLMVASAVRSTRTSRVSWILPEEEQINPAKMHEWAIEEHKKNKIKKNLMKLVTLEEIRAFNALTELQLQQQVSEIIPLPQALQMPVAELYQQIVGANSEELTKIFNDTAMVVGNMSVDIFDRFFNVVCLNENVLQHYQMWLKGCLILAIINELNDRVEKIKHQMKAEHEHYLARLQIEQEKYDVVMTEQERIMQNTVKKKIATFTIIPMLAYIQFWFYESQVMRWISYAAFAGLTIAMLNQYGKIIQKSSLIIQRWNHFQQIIAKEQERVEKLKLPEVRVVDEVAGRLMHELYERIKDYVAYEQDRLENVLQREREKDERLKNLIEEELKVEKKNPLKNNSVESVEQAGRVLRNPVVRSLLKTARGFNNFLELFSNE